LPEKAGAFLLAAFFVAAGFAVLALVFAFGLAAVGARVECRGASWKSSAPASAGFP
jgi:hypothetical protein